MTDAAMWQAIVVDWPSTDNRDEVGRLLCDGWEPFAAVIGKVDATATERERLWLRRRVGCHIGDAGAQDATRDAVGPSFVARAET